MAVIVPSWYRYCTHNNTTDSCSIAYHFLSILLIQFKSFCCLFKCLWVRKYIIWWEHLLCTVYYVHYSVWISLYSLTCRKEGGGGMELGWILGGRNWGGGIWGLNEMLQPSFSETSHLHVHEHVQCTVNPYHFCFVLFFCFCVFFHYFWQLFHKIINVFRKEYTFNYCNSTVKTTLVD